MGENRDGFILTVLIVSAAIGLLLMVRAVYLSRKLSRDAREDYAYKRENNMDDQDLSEDEYVAIYKRVNAPRAGGYIGATLILITALTPVAFGIASLVGEGVYRASGRSEAFLPGFLLWKFMLFFVIIGLWAAIAATAARLYHKFSPSTYRNEVIKFKVARDEGQKY